VGLAQNRIEAAGIATASLSLSWEVTRSTGAPRIAAIEYPMGRPFGAAGDFAGQRTVLAAALDAAAAASVPGEVAHLPFVWPVPLAQAQQEPPEPPPIMKLLASDPAMYLKLLTGTFPRD
jgi:hypothetical protein